MFFVIGLIRSVQRDYILYTPLQRVFVALRPVDIGHS